MLFLHSPFSLRSLPFKKSIFEAKRNTFEAEQNVSPLEAEQNVSPLEAEQNVSPLEAECVPLAGERVGMRADGIAAAQAAREA